jgi:hypothetical protein
MATQPSILAKLAEALIKDRILEFKKELKGSASFLITRGFFLIHHDESET